MKADVQSTGKSTGKVLLRSLNESFLDIRTKLWQPSLRRVVHKLSWTSAKAKKTLQNHQLPFFQLIFKKKILLELESNHLSTQGSLTFDLYNEIFSKYFKYCRCIHLVFWMYIWKNTYLAVFHQFWKLNMGNSCIVHISIFRSHRI